MSMSPESKNLEGVRRLLALKRYEQPPAGYFHGFSRQVIVRIKAGELGNESEASIWSFGAGSVFQRVWATLDARPVFAGAFGVAVCGFFVVGALLSDTGATAADNNGSSSPTMVAAQPPVVWTQGTSDQFSSTVAVAPPNQAKASLFEEIKYYQQVARPQQVDFRVTAP